MYPKERRYLIKRKRHAENGWRSDGWAIYDFFSPFTICKCNCMQIVIAGGILDALSDYLPEEKVLKDFVCLQFIDFTEWLDLLSAMHIDMTPLSVPNCLKNTVCSPIIKGSVGYQLLLRIHNHRYPNLCLKIYSTVSKINLEVQWMLKTCWNRRICCVSEICLGYQHIDFTWAQNADECTHDENVHKLIKHSLCWFLSYIFNCWFFKELWKIYCRRAKGALIFRREGFLIPAFARVLDAILFWTFDVSQ